METQDLHSATVGYPLSLEQKRIWSAGRPQFVQGLVLLSGNFNLERFSRIWNDVVQKHEILRTSFVEPADSALPLQVIADKSRIIWDELDAPTARPGDTQFTAILREHREKCADWKRGTICSSVVKMAGGVNAWCITLPAILSDVASLEHLIGSVLDSYNRRDSSGQARDSDLLQYVNYVEWQKSVEWESDSTRFREALSAPREIRIPFESDGSAGKVETRVELSITPQLCGAVLACARDCDVSQASFFLASWRLLLGRITGSSGLVIGFPVDGRTSEGLIGAVGPFTKYLPVHIEVSPGEDFRSVVRAVEDASNHLPLMVHARTENVEPYGTAFNWYTPHLPPDGELSARIEILYPFLDSCKISLSCIEYPDGPRAWIAYDAERMDAAYMNHLAGQLVALMECASANPDVTVRNLNLLSQAERDRLLVDFNRTAADYPMDRCFHQVFEKQVRRTPEAAAITFGSRIVRYSELNKLANAIAAWLLEVGACPESRIGLAVNRSPQMVAALIGILKSGASYVPLDMEQPQARLTQVVEQSGVSVVIVSPERQAAVQVLGIRALVLDDNLTPNPDSDPVVNILPENTAYIIYTSGTMGKLKGVMVTHRSLMNYLTWCTRTYSVSQGSGIPLFSPISFDLTITALLAPLLVGQTIHLVPEEGGIDQLIATLTGLSDLSLIKLTPAHVSLLNQTLTPAQAAKLSRRLVIGGENLSGGLLDFWFKNARQTRIINEYGPTETVVGCCVYEATPDPAPRKTVPIGHPIANTQIYVVDETMTLVPVGLSGELLIGGHGVARGYSGLPALTAEKFVPNPFTSVPGERLYRSGDIARMLPTGDLECLGRLDDQVKIRGFRIEPGEIETAFRTNPNVMDVVVLVTGDTPDDRSLVSFVVIAPKSGVGEKELRDHAEKCLPNYMMATIVIVPAIPLTQNGKVDRKALLEYKNDRQKTYEPVSLTELELLLSSTFCQVLEIPRIELEDNFFALGGHSLKATQLISRLGTILGIELPFQLLFDNPKLRDFAVAVDAQLKSAEGIQIRAIQPAPRDVPVPLSYAQERLWFVEQLDPGGPAYNTPVPLRLRGTLNITALERALSEIIRRHEMLRTVFHSVEGVAYQVITDPSKLSLEVVEVGDEKQARRWIDDDMTRGFDLSRGPLLRVKLLRLGPDDHVVALNMHHIVSDGWSIGVLLRETSALYEAHASGQESPLPELVLQYADYAVWQRDWLQGEVLERQLEYWKKQLLGAPTLLRLPLDHERPSTQSRQGETHSFKVEPGTLQQLRRLSQEEGTTVFMVLLAVFQTLLHYYSGQTDIVVGTDDANRLRGETEGLIGFFINQLALRSDLSGNPAFREFLQRVRQTTLDAYIHNAAPFERVVDALKLDRTLQHEPVFQVKMVMENATTEQTYNGSLNIEPFLLDGIAAKYDLTFTMSEYPNALLGAITFRTTLFERSTIERMAEHYRTLLALIVENADAALSALRTLLYSRTDKSETRDSQGRKLKARKPMVVKVGAE